MCDYCNCINQTRPKLGDALNLPGLSLRLNNRGDRDDYRDCHPIELQTSPPNRNDLPDHSGTTRERSHHARSRCGGNPHRRVRIDFRGYHLAHRPVGGAGAGGDLHFQQLAS